MKKKIKKNAWQELAKLNAAPSVKIAAARQEPRNGLKAFAIAYDREQESERNAALRAALFTEESAELTSRCGQISEDFFAGFTNEQATVLIRGAFDGFRLALEASGVKLEASALTKLQTIARQNLSLNVTDPSVWQKIYDYAFSLGVFSSHDVTQLAHAQPEQEVEPSLDLESIDTTTRDGEKTARELVANEVFGVDGETRKTWNAWLAQLKRDYDFEPTKAQQEAAIYWFQRNARSFLDYNAYNACRRALSLSGDFEEGMFTADERLSLEIENDLDTQTYEGRNRIKRELSQLR